MAQLTQYSTTIKNLKILGKQFRDKFDSTKIIVGEKELVIVRLEKDAASLRENFNSLQLELLNAQNEKKANVSNLESLTSKLENLQKTNTELENKVVRIFFFFFHALIHQGSSHTKYSKNFTLFNM